MNLPSQAPPITTYKTPLSADYDWYLILADDDHLSYIEDIIISTPVTYRMALITNARLTRANRRLIHSKNIYLIEFDRFKESENELVKILQALIIPSGVGCIQIQAHSKLAIAANAILASKLKLKAANSH